MQQNGNHTQAATTMDPAKEINAWKAYFAYAAQDLGGESPEILVACAHRLLEMTQEQKGNRRGGRRRVAQPVSEPAAE